MHLLSWLMDAKLQKFELLVHVSWGAQFFLVNFVCQIIYALALVVLWLLSTSIWLRRLHKLERLFILITYSSTVRFNVQNPLSVKEIVNVWYSWISDFLWVKTLIQVYQRLSDSKSLVVNFTSLRKFFSAGLFWIFIWTGERPNCIQ